MRQAATDTLNAWLEQTGLTCFVEGELLSTALATDSPYLRADVRMCNCVCDNVIMYSQFCKSCKNVLHENFLSKNKANYGI